MTQIPDLLLGSRDSFLSSHTPAFAELTVGALGAWAAEPQTRQCPGLQGQGTAECGALGLCRVSVLCTHRGWLWISADPACDRRPQGFPAASGVWVQDELIESNPDLTWAAALPSWMSRVPTTFASGSPVCIRSCCKSLLPLAPVLIHAWAPNSECSESPFTVSAS